MKITALGVTGGTGRWFVEQALDAGHEVTAVARRPEAVVPAAHERLEIVGAGLGDVDRVRAAVTGRDVVVSALGVTSLLQARKGPTVYSQSAHLLAPAAAASPGTRLVVVSSGGVEEQPGDGWFYTNVLKRFFLEPAYRDMRVMEEVVRAGAAPWTVVRPPYLTGDRQRTDYRVSVGSPLPDDGTLSRWSLAHLLLQVAESPEKYDGTVVWAST